MLSAPTRAGPLGRGVRQRPPLNTPHQSVNRSLTSWVKLQNKSTLSTVAPDWGAPFRHCNSPSLNGEATRQSCLRSCSMGVARRMRACRSTCRCCCARCLGLVVVALLGDLVYVRLQGGNDQEGDVLALAYQISYAFEVALETRCTNNVPVHDVDATLSWAAAVREAYPDIRREYEAYLAAIGAKPRLYGEHGFDLDGTGLYIDQQRGWRSIFLRVYSLDTAVARAFPKTMAAYANAGQQVTTIFFSVLDPGAQLTPHHGPYKGILRYHLCVRTQPTNSLLPQPRPFSAVELTINRGGGLRAGGYRSPTCRRRSSRSRCTQSLGPKRRSPIGSKPKPAAETSRQPQRPSRTHLCGQRARTCSSTMRSYTRRGTSGESLAW